MTDCDNSNIPRQCADKFSELRAGQMEIKMLLSDHIEKHKTAGARMWDAIKLALAAGVGWIIKG